MWEKQLLLHERLVLRTLRRLRNTHDTAAADLTLAGCSCVGVEHTNLFTPEEIALHRTRDRKL